MKEATKRPSLHPFRWSIGLGLVLTALLLALAYGTALVLRQTRIGRPALLVLGQVGPFALTNQAGEQVTLTNLLGKVWLADVIFTRCQSTCLNLTHRLAALQARLPTADKVQLVSLTADPEHDTPPVLQQYAALHEAQSGRWQFLTGQKKEVYRLAIEDLKFTVQDKTQEKGEPLEEMFLHSTLFVVVDKQGRIRGYFPGTEPAGADQALAAVYRLVREH